MNKRCYLPQAGFTLIELMIAVVVVAVISVIAIPNYSEYVRRGARAEAMASLLQGAAQMQQQFTLNNSYAGTAPIFKSTTKYSVLLAASATTNAFTLVATPLSADNKCGAFTVDQSGLRGLSGSHTASVADCWSGK